MDGVQVIERYRPNTTMTVSILENAKEPVLIYIRRPGTAVRDDIWISRRDLAKLVADLDKTLHHANAHNDRNH